ncbi:MAG: response regulator [Candidatus Methylomirabilia bacterium]
MKVRTNLKLAIVEDHRATLNYLTALFHGTEGIEVVGAYATGREAVEGLRRTLPNVIIADLGLPDMSGLEVIASIKEYFPLVEIIVLTMHEDREHLLAAFRAGASGYLLKGLAAVDILAAVRTAAAGGSPLCAKVARSLVQELRQGRGPIPVPALTAREREVLRLLATGLSEKQLAGELSLSPNTVHTHVGKIYRKLHARSKTEALLKAREKGLLD